MIIPGLEDGNAALNTLALGLIQYKLLTGKILPESYEEVINTYTNDFAKPETSQSTKYLYLQEIQRHLACLLRSDLIELLKQIEQYRHSSIKLKKLFPFFMRAFLRYYVSQTKTNFVEFTEEPVTPRSKFYESLCYQIFSQESPSIFKKYEDQIFSESLPCIFKQMMDELPLSNATQMQVKSTLESYWFQKKLHAKFWPKAVKQYLEAIKHEGVSIGGLELSLLAKMPKLIANVKINGLKHRRISGKGHCLYTAVGFYLIKNQDELRHEVINQLEQNLERFRNVRLPQGKTIEDYLNDVRNGIEWEGYVEIEVLMRILNRPIVVIGPNNRIINADDLNRFNVEPMFVTGLEQLKGKPIFVYHDGFTHDGFIHYDALQLKKGFKEEDIWDDFLNRSNSNENSQEELPINKIKQNPLFKIFYERPIGIYKYNNLPCSQLPLITLIYSSQASPQACWGVIYWRNSHNHKPDIENIINGLEYQPILGEGHCLYTAVGSYLKKNQQDELRHEVINQLEQNLERFREVRLPPKKTIESCLNDVRNGIELDRVVEIEVLMRALNRPIIIIEEFKKVTNAADKCVATSLRI